MSTARLNVKRAEARDYSVLISCCIVLSAAALADLGIRAAVRLELRWDTFWYHLPFAALRGGLHIPFDMNESRWPYYQGFPPLPHLVQGILWRLTGSVNATGVVNYLAFAGFLAYCHFVLRARAWLVSLIALSAPLVIIHTATSYIDLFGNSLLAIGLTSCLYLYLYPESAASRVAFAGALCGLAGAAWSKYVLVPVVAAAFLLLVCIRGRRQTLVIVAAALVAAAPYVKNWTGYGNPFWPVEVPFAADLFPFTVSTTGRFEQRPPPLKDAPQSIAFVHSLLEIHHPARYSDRPRWIIDQGNAWTAYRAGGFWAGGVVTYLTATILMLALNHGRRGVAASLAMAAMLGFVSILPQSNELRYYLFLPLCWAAAVGMEFPMLKQRAPRSAALLLVVVIGLFLYMVAENSVHYRIEKMNWAGAAELEGMPEWWRWLRRDKTYCAMNFGPSAILLTGPTYSEYTVVDRSHAELCPAGSVILTR